MNPDSRYQQGEVLFVPSHTYDSQGNVENVVGTATPNVVSKETSYRLTTLPLPDPPSTTYMVKVTDNITLLAKTQFNDPQKWWVLADANPHIRHPLDLKATDVIYLPT